MAYHLLIDGKLVACKREIDAVDLPRFSVEADSAEHAHDSSYGSGASIWSRDVDRAEALGDKANAGAAWINRHLAMGLTSHSLERSHRTSALKLGWRG